MVAKNNTNKDSLGSILLNNSLYLLFIVFLIVFTIINPAFLSKANILILLENCSAMLMLSLGMGFILLLGEIDLSVGSILCAGGMLWGHLVSTYEVNMLLSTIIVIAVGMICGLLNALLVSKLHIGSFLATLGVQIFIRGIIYTLTNCVQINLSDRVTAITAYRVGGLISPVALIALLFVVLCALFYKYTGFGRFIKATGTNRIGAKKVGINTDKVVFISFIICGALAALGGAMHCYINSSTHPSRTGNGDEFTAITACVLGGVSLFGGVGTFFPGILIGVFFLKLIENALNIVGADPFLFPVYKGALIFLAMLVDSLKRNFSHKSNS